VLAQRTSRHGAADGGSRWASTGRRLQAAGFSTYMLDLARSRTFGGARGHLSRFSQLLGDLQAFRRAVRMRSDAPQVLLGHSFGGLVVLRYLETQPGDPLAGRIVSSPWLGLAHRPPAWKRLAARVFSGSGPRCASAPHRCGSFVSRPGRERRMAADPATHNLMTPGAWAEIRWAQRAVTADGIASTALCCSCWRGRSVGGRASHAGFRRWPERPLLHRCTGIRRCTTRS